MKREFKGNCIGVLLKERGGAIDRHICFSLLIEDDGEWRETDFSVSSSWIDETIEMLQAARSHMKDHASPDVVDRRQYGYRFK